MILYTQLYKEMGLNSSKDYGLSFLRINSKNVELKAPKTFPFV